MQDEHKANDRTQQDAPRSNEVSDSDQIVCKHCESKADHFYSICHKCMIEFLLPDYDRAIQEDSEDG